MRRAARRGHARLGSDAWQQWAVHADEHVLGALLQQRLRSQHVLHLNPATAAAIPASRKNDA